MKKSDNYSLSLFGGQQPTDIFRKPVQASQMIIQNDVMTGQQLLAWNILVKNAKEQKDLWDKDPNKLRDMSRTYKIGRRELMERMDYKSTNRKPFKEALIKMQGLKATWDVLGVDNENKWASCVLLPFVQVDDDFVTYAFVNQIEPMLFESAIYSKLDLVIQRMLKLDSSKKLYDWLNRYRTNPSHLSNKDTWLFWKNILQGAVDENTYNKEYKIFKRDKLKPAIKEINEISDLIIELIEDKDGTRGVKFLQFKVKEKPRFESETEEKKASKAVKIDINKEFAKLKVSAYIKKKLLATYTEPLIIANINYMLELLKTKDDIKNQGAYLSAACQANYAKFDPRSEVKMEEKVDSVTQSKIILDAIHRDRNLEAEKMFNEMLHEEQIKAINEYNDSVSLSEEIIPEDPTKRGNRHLKPFYSWLAKQTWGDPSPEEIIRYALRSA